MPLFGGAFSLETSWPFSLHRITASDSMHVHYMHVGVLHFTSSFNTLVLYGSHLICTLARRVATNLYKNSDTSVKKLLNDVGMEEP